MAEEFVFQDLLSAIKDSVIQANATAQQSSLESIFAWFEKDGTPKLTEFRLPTLDPGAPVQTIQVPLISLIPLSSTKIDKLSVEFNVHFSELVHRPEDPRKADSLRSSVSAEPDPKNLSLMFARRGKQSEPNLAKIQIEIRSTDPPEALLRINDHLMKYLP
ncbi:uncharacterized protein DUF2589 [Tumebacillus sp. BK434]|uniref:DUF2589 domain-containing protein n=1 Tax=Tumebacillus sp. BK434 TaxID=2512169 RepID=UPI0010451679|nr:DUF2589 domain-containing protein [Tumebacillus sp. BK434]TCP49427.1 uncharacterized protein DUF2589 [Tumebacillus sp. BK434]